MTRTKWIWLIVVLVYAAFFSWYTSFGGPLNEKEIAYYSERFESLEPPLPARAWSPRVYLFDITSNIGHSGKYGA